MFQGRRPDNTRLCSFAASLLKEGAVRSARDLGENGREFVGTSINKGQMYKFEASPEQDQTC